jgi:hypothetical protein
MTYIIATNEKAYMTPFGTRRLPGLICQRSLPCDRVKYPNTGDDQPTWSSALFRKRSADPM